ncbi:rhamnan synthesis F family protein [Planktomarina temperata]|nr:rhamnan synthesis F family protein [Planktomarina temperata]
MIPGWKLKREVKRLKIKASAIPLALYEPFIQRKYDRNRHNLVTHHYGKTTLKCNLAVFLIFQPNGISNSVFNTCAYLNSEGFTPVIVCNGPITEADRNALKELSYLIIERPNFGYDFGGYRDGLWTIEKIGIKPDKVLLLNDSVWFPAFNDSTFFAEMLQGNQDFVGTQVFDRGQQCGTRRYIYGSYCLLLNNSLINSTEFQNFWRGYKLSSNKETTIRRGEREFSFRMINSTKNATGIYSIDRFNSVVENLGSEKLREALGDMIATDPALERNRTQLSNARTSTLWIDDSKNLLRAGAQTKNYIGSSPIISIREMGFPMIKKNNERLYALARQRIAIAANEGRLNGLNPVVLSEIEAVVSNQGQKSQVY